MLCGRRVRDAAALAVLAFLLLAAPGAAQTAPSLPARRGPFEAREEWLLAQPRLTLPALSPDPLGRGARLLRLDFDWGNDFGRGGTRYFVDGEHRALAVTLGLGLTDSLSLGARVPLLWRGGGFLDRFADAIHTLGFPDNGRPLFPRDRLSVAAIDAQGRAIAWTGSGAGLGKLELEAKLTPLRPLASRTAFAVAGRVALPTGSGEFAGGGADAGLQALLALGIGERFDLYLGAGATFAGERRSQGFEYRRTRPFGHIALEWRFARLWSALAQADGGGRLLTNVPGYPGLQSYLRLGFKHDFGARTRAEAAFTENMKKQQATTDFGLYIALRRRF
jgi:hypothetical protein